MLQAILIKWTNSTRNYVNPQGGVDYQILASNQVFPSNDPNFNPVLPDSNEELLIMTTVVSESTPDLRVYDVITNSVPTNTKNAMFVNINEFQTSSHYQFKSIDELTASIKQRELEANTKVCILADFSKLQMVNSPVMTKAQTLTMPLTAIEQAIYDRTMEVQNAGIANDTNARRLIEIAISNAVPEAVQQAFDINSGWQEDGITPLNIPFNELIAQ